MDLLELILEYTSRHPDLEITFFTLPRILANNNKNVVFRFADMKTKKKFAHCLQVPILNQTRYPENYLKEIFEEAEYEMYKEERNANENA